MEAKEIVKTIKFLEIHTNCQVNEMFVGNYKSSFRGQGLEVSDVRKYEEGDDARHIDWIITARQGKPYVKKYQETRELTTMVMVDVSNSMNFSSKEKTKANVALETAAIVLFSALKNNDKFGAIIFADKIYAYIPPKKGKKHLLQILREIIQGQNEATMKSADLAMVFNFLNKTIKKRSFCFLLSDNLLDNKAEQNLMPLKIANKKHDFVYINLFDNFEKKITDDFPIIKMINPENGEVLIIDLSNKNLVEKYNKLRSEKYKKEADLIKKNAIDFMSISTTENIYKNLLLFFKKRALKY